MMIQIFTLPLFYDAWLGGNPENVIRLAGSLLICGAVAVLFVKLGAGAPVKRSVWVAEPQPE
jgi:maltose/moltooligosaccharide transporter